MRPLNRPMFRYGGPIKEGIMSGIKEPRQNYNRAGKVLKYIPGGQKLVNKISTSTKDIIPRTIQKVKNFYSGDPSRYGVPAAEGIKQKALRFLKPDEKAGLLTNKYIFDRTVVPVAGGAKFAFQKAAPYATAGGLTLGGGYALFGGDDKPNINKTGGPEGPPSIINPPGGKKGGSDTPPPPGVQLTDKEKRAQQIQKYRDIMDIKGMNKEAAYDSLIAASAAVNQAGGDLKGAIKDGSLINQIIQSTSKAFDKPKKTKDAIDTLILKGEIEKDLNSEKEALANELTKKRIQVADKQIAGDTLQDTANAIYAKTGAFPSGNGLAGLARTKGIDVKMVIKSDDINNYLEDNPTKDAVDFMELQVIEAKKSGTPVEPGAYVVKDRIIVIDSQGTVAPYL